MTVSLMGEELCLTRRPFLAADCNLDSCGDLRLLPVTAPAVRVVRLSLQVAVNMIDYAQKQHVRNFSIGECMSVLACLMGAALCCTWQPFLSAG